MRVYCIASVLSSEGSVAPAARTATAGQVVTRLTGSWTLGHCARLGSVSAGQEQRSVSIGLLLGTSLKVNCLKIFKFFILDIVYCKQTGMQ